MIATKLTEAYHLIDQANAEDPNMETVGGIEMPKELIYGKRMTETLDKFEPTASDALKLAARAQHICRWQIPRDRYPMDRTGYLKWRTDLKKFHADKASSILIQVGFEGEVIERVAFLLQKKQLKRDKETQVLEDVICLVFLEHYYDDFLQKHPDDKIIDILQKTWKKMSDKGHSAALELSYSEKGLALVKKAIAN